MSLSSSGISVTSGVSSSLLSFLSVSAELSVLLSSSAGVTVVSGVWAASASLFPFLSSLPFGFLSWSALFSFSEGVTVASGVSVTSGSTLSIVSPSVLSLSVLSLSAMLSVVLSSALSFF